MEQNDGKKVTSAGLKVKPTWHRC